MDITTVMRARRADDDAYIGVGERTNAVSLSVAQLALMYFSLCSNKPLSQFSHNTRTHMQLSLSTPFAQLPLNSSRRALPPVHVRKARHVQRSRHAVTSLRIAKCSLLPPLFL